VEVSRWKTLARVVDDCLEWMADNLGLLLGLLAFALAVFISMGPRPNCNVELSDGRIITARADCTGYGGSVVVGGTHYGPGAWKSCTCGEGVRP
jgi:hypothetical protein